MSETVISVENLGKRYRIRHQAEGRARYSTLRDVLADKTKSAARRLWSAVRPSSISPLPRSRASREDFWALKDVSFEVRQGRRSASSAATARASAPCSRSSAASPSPPPAACASRAASPACWKSAPAFTRSLTGRENIFLNGAILGMTKAEIRRKFDEIVAFAEVEKFLDTPVKRYSSGMYVRLAFAVAAHLEPEILIVDEVLAVGDAEFQKKCLGKMGDVARGGRTVLFVSHNMGAIGRLCRRCLVLEQGRLRADLEPRAAIALYLDSGMRQQTGRVDLMKFPDRTGDGSARIVEACLRDQRGNLSNCFSIGDSIQVECIVEYQSHSAAFSHSIEITNSDGVPVYHLWDMDSRSDKLPPVRRRAVCARLQPLDLFPDRYFVTLWAGDTQGTRADRVADCLSFTIEQSNANIKRPLHKSKGLIYKVAEWSYKEASSMLPLLSKIKHTLRPRTRWRAFRQTPRLYREHFRYALRHALWDEIRLPIWVTSPAGTRFFLSEDPIDEAIARDIVSHPDRLFPAPRIACVHPGRDSRHRRASWPLRSRSAAPLSRPQADCRRASSGLVRSHQEEPCGQWRLGPIACRQRVLGAGRSRDARCVSTRDSSWGATVQAGAGGGSPSRSSP